jgi:hypothetical protein
MVTAFGGVAVFVACGGRIANGPPGTLDDAGVFHEPDGNVLFSPGSACEHFDAAQFIAETADPPSCSDPGSVDGGVSGESASCEAWVVDAGLSFGYMPYAECVDGRCARPSINVREPARHCTWGSPGADAYCTAFYQQFVVHGAVNGGCLTLGDHAHDYCTSATCEAAPLAGGVPQVAVFVGPNSSTCTSICQ